jgi:Mrp family chromosome partitioning ATPase/capsular polysaccharide biosynthesis protein
MNETTDATAIFAPLWRRKWLILAVGIAVGAASYFYAKRERPTYAASTQIYLGVGVEEQAPGEKATITKASTIADQSAVINTIVLEKVRRQLRAQNQGALLRGTTLRAAPQKSGEFITISTEAHSPTNAALLANLTAEAYIRRADAKRRNAVEKAITIARRQLRRIEASNVPQVTPGSATSKRKAPTSSSPSSASIIQATNLNTKINELESKLGLTGAQHVKPARPAASQLLKPKPRKDAIFGFVLGIVLAAIAAYALSRFDRRLRSPAGIEEVFNSQIIAALPKVTRPIVTREGTPAPSKHLLEPLRRLHTALQLGERPEHEPRSAGRVVLFISPDTGDGKSTLVADLALVQRDAGQRVAVVEANFRRPVQSKLLGLDGGTHGAYGLADVLAGTIPVEEAMKRVRPVSSAGAADPTASGEVALATVESRAGSLFLLAGAAPVPNPPALLAQAGVPGLLSSLAADFDFVLIDAPTPLEFSDVMPLLSLAEGLVIVARVAHTREVAAQRLVYLLHNVSSSPVLGVVANGLGRKDSERYGFSSSNGRVWPGNLRGR